MYLSNIQNSSHKSTLFFNFFCGFLCLCASPPSLWLSLALFVSPPVFLFLFLFPYAALSLLSFPAALSSPLHVSPTSCLSLTFLPVPLSFFPVLFFSFFSCLGGGRRREGDSHKCPLLFFLCPIHCSPPLFQSFGPIAFSIN